MIAQFHFINIKFSSDGQSEEWIGEWLEKRGVRDEFVIATKYSSNYLRAHPNKLQVNAAGNSRKSLFTSVEASLKKLRTHYIDLLYIHWWDFTTPIEEVMQGLNQLVVSGKVLYLGVSDTPAWVVAKANQYARDHGLSQFVVYQGKWSIAVRDLETEILPMTKGEGMGIAPWGVLGQGMFKTDEEIAKIQAENEKTRQPRGKGFEATREITKVLERIAKEKGSTVGAIATAFVLAKTPYVFPILGGRKVSQLEDNIKGLEVKLTDADLKVLEEASPLARPFPYDMIGTKQGESFILAATARHDWVAEPHAI